MSAASSDSDAVVIGRDDISDFNPEQVLPQSPEDIKKIRSWLQPTSYDIVGGEYRKHQASHAAGTGSWLTSSSTYRKWLNSTEHGILWIKGIPGSGKSVMAANLIDEITKSNPGSPVLYFFFRQIIDANHEPEALLRDWMDQLLIYSPPLQKKLKAYVEDQRSIDSISMVDMWVDLQSSFARLPGKVFCVADALDEMDQGHDDFLRALGHLGKWRPGKVKVLITSRPVPRVEEPLRKAPCLNLRLEASLVDVDISTFVHSSLSRSDIPQQDWQTIADAVPGRANGLFLYAKLAMDAFLEPGADINAVLPQLPADLNVLYTRLLKEHAQRSGVAPDLQHLILQSVTHAARPLRLLELAEMISVTDFDNSKRDLKTTKDLIRAACGPLLEILADETVSVIHHSFTEYLKGSTRIDDGSGYPVLQKGPTHEQLAIACLRYLQAGCLDGMAIKIKDECNSDSVVESDYDDAVYGPDRDSGSNAEVQLRLKYPFVDYAASNWSLHIINSEAVGHDQAEVNAALGGFLGVSQRMHAWLQMRWPGGAKNAGRVTKLHIAAQSGLVSFTQELLKTMEPDIFDASHKTPLWCAATRGRSEVIAKLIAAGANPDQDEAVRGCKPLHEAASRNHAGAVKVLLEAGVDPLTPKTRENPGRRCGNARTTVGETPLMYACDNGHLETVGEFLPYLKDIDCVHDALAWAAASGRSKVVARILQHPGVDVNAKVRGDTPLFRACGNSDSSTIITLLKAGADPKITCANSGSEFVPFRRMLHPRTSADRMPNCLHQLCRHKTRGRYEKGLEDDELREIFSLLVEAGIDVHARTPSGGTALLDAVGSPILTRLLLDAGADANATDDSGSTPLHKATLVDTVSLLVEHGGADINLRQADGQTPLLSMLSTYHTETVLKFLEYCPDCNVVNNDGNGALHVSLKRSGSRADVINALLKAGADPRLENRAGDTPLHFMSQNCDTNFETMDMLLRAGADIDGANRQGRTLLFHTLQATQSSSRKDLHNDIKGIIERGASILTRDFSGRTLLHEAVKIYQVGRFCPRVPRFDFLIGLGLDIKAVDYGGNNLLHELARRENNHGSEGLQMVLFWERLLDMGLDLEHKNHAGRTPLHILSATNLPQTLFKQKPMPIDLVISRAKDLNSKDHDGVTPLHLAVTRGELYAKKLLCAGADPLASTNEGLTALHLASRCRQSNVVGLLLDALRAQDTSAIANDAPHTGVSNAQPSDEVAPSTKLVLGVNARAFGPRNENITPLFYACRSGRPETVALLLEAGADVNIGSTLQGCLEFEEEDRLWTIHGQVDGTALKLEDTFRPMNSPTGGRALYHGLRDDEETRLEEILDMLVRYGLDIFQSSRPRWNGSFGDVNAEGEYTAECLSGARNKNNSHFKTHSDSSKTFAECMKQSRLMALEELNLIKVGDSHKNMFRDLMSTRKYYLVEQMAHLGASFLPIPGQGEESNLSALVHHGFGTLVEKIGTIAAKSGLEKGDWHAFEDRTRPGLFFAGRDLSKPGNKGCNPTPFLLEAVRRKLPNMDVVRLLVERFEVDIDELYYETGWTEGKKELLPIDSALLYVVRGDSWWHVHQALPYLLKAGADVNVRNNKGQTSLLVAINANESRLGPFHKEAIKMLVAAGADVNAVDLWGQTCLSCAQYDIDTVKLLTAHGALVTAESIITAIDVKNVEALEALLSGGVDVNIRRDRVTKETPNRKSRPNNSLFGSGSRTVDHLEPHEEFPLYHAAFPLGVPSNPMPQRYRELEVGMQLVRVLLEHGANPFARFLIASGVCDETTTSRSSTMVPKGYREGTILHEILRVGSLPENFLYLPGLDVDRRDASGRTLLHAACGGRNGPDYILGSYKNRGNESTGVTVFHHLISLGADLKARDNFDRNVLHFMIAYGFGNEFDKFKDSLAYVLDKAPELVNQADYQGRTPLHHVVERASCKGNTEVAQLLLAIGADPSVVDQNGDNVLHILGRRHLNLALCNLFKDLVRRGADVHKRNVRGETPVFGLFDRPMTANTFLLPFQQHKIQDDGEMTIGDVVVAMKDLGVDFFVTDARGRGLLHVAARGDAGPFKLLMEMGLDPMLEDDMHQTSVDVAAACADKEILELFEKKI